MRQLLAFVFTLALIAAVGCNRTTQMKGKWINIPLKDNVRTSDPTNCYDVVSGEVTDNIYEGLYQYDYYSDTAEVIPALADGMPKVSADGKTYTFKIKKGLRFQDDPCFKTNQGKGREVKAEDFIYGWKRHANPANESQAFWIWDGKVVGINDFQKKFGQGKSAEEVMAEPVEGFKALDDYTVQIKLTKVYPQLLQIMTMHFTSPVPKEAIQHYGKDFVNHPVGTGPFKMQTWNPTSQMLLVRNENFREEFFPDLSKNPKYKHLAPYAGKRLPLADGLNFTVVKEEQPRWLGFLDGKYDKIEIPKDNFQAAYEGQNLRKELADKGIFSTVEPSLVYWYASMNVKDPVLGKSKYLRQAIASAIDANGWLQLFKNGRGSLQTEVGPPSLKDRCGKPYRWTYNVERAKQLLAKAGYPDGKGLPTLKWDTRGTNQSERQIAEFVAKNLAAIGIKLETISNTFPAYLEKSAKGNLQMSKGGWNMDYPDAENNYQLLYGPNGPPGPNEACFDNPEFNKLYEKMAAMTSGPERRKIICQMEDIIQEEAPWAYVMYETIYHLASKRIKTYHVAELVYSKYKFIDVTDENDKTVAAAH